MPSARKRRLRKIIKGFLNRTTKTGTKPNPTYQDRVNESAALNLLNEADLKTALGIALDGDKVSYDADADTVLRGDVQPFDARESRDTDRDGIGDNRDILLTKERLDAIYFEKKDGIAGPLTGSLYDSISTQVSIETEIDTVVALPQTNPTEIAAKKSTLLSLQDDENVYTLEGLASLETKITGEKETGVSLKSSIAAMTADSDVTINDEPFYDLSPYNQLGGSEKAFNDAAATSVTGPADAALVEVDSMETAVSSIQALE